MKLSEDKKRKYQIVTLLFSLLLGVSIDIAWTIYTMTTSAVSILSLIVAGFSWLSIHLAFVQWKNSQWMLLAMKMVLYFCGMITVPYLIFLIKIFIGSNETYFLVLLLFGWFTMVLPGLAIVLIIPFGFLSYWLSRLSSTESEENQFIEK